MKRWATLWIMMVGLLVPCTAWAQTDEGEQEQAADTQEVQKEDEKQGSPIKRLAELTIDQYVVPARMINLPLPGKTQTLQEVLDKLDDWVEDDKVGAVLLNLEMVNLSLPDVQELRTGIEKLKKADKKVMAYMNGGGATAYLLACSADEIAMAPPGGIYVPGFGALFPFMKGHYQMLGLEFEVITCGKYKYPGFVNRREPDEYFKEEYGAILDGMYAEYKQMIAQGRELPEDMVAEIIDTAILDTSAAQQRGLIDTVAYLDEYRERILRRERMKRYKGMDEGLENVNSIQDLVELINESMQEAAEARRAVGPKIAVLHARGPIIDINLGAGLASQVISRDDFAEVVDELRENKSIKAVVMRVDSPGGSAYASDVIWQHLRRLNDTKPLVVSMGTVAGSGGYYIACPGRRIFAQPTTITGSIGVLGIFQSARSMYNRMDYELYPMQRGERALLGAPHRDLAPEDRQLIQDHMDDTYDMFIERVAQTRRIPAEQVRRIAGGRIYTGRDALDIGLVDELGGLGAAIESARQMANIPPSAEIKVLHYPRPSSLGEFFASFSAVSAQQAVELFQKSNSPAQRISFHDQLMIFSQRFQPLCWMGVPEFYLNPWGRQDVAIPEMVLPSRRPEPISGLLGK